MVVVVVVVVVVAAVVVVVVVIEVAVVVGGIGEIGRIRGIGVEVVIVATAFDASMRSNHASSMFFLQKQVLKHRLDAFKLQLLVRSCHFNTN